MQSSPTTPSADLLQASRSVVSILPFLYIAWADGLLTPNECKEIRDRLKAQDWISEADYEMVQGWLDPDNPPAPAVYYRWIAAIRTAARHIPNAAHKTLAQLGVEMAEVEGRVAGFSGEAALAALSDLEEALGVVGAEITHDLLEARPPELAEAEAAAGFDVVAMKRLLDGDHIALRDRIRERLQDPAFNYVSDLSMSAYRERVYFWCKLLAEEGWGALAFPTEVGGGGSLEKFIVAFETLAYHDLSLVIKYGVQFGLFGGSIQQLGTEKHHKKYLPDVGTLELPGCFAMSELGHGSNVREIGTTAIFDKARDGFVINTPTDAARKEWIGNAAVHGRLATVFAQLEIDGQQYGVHAFLVPIRDRAGVPMPRVRIADEGHKMGLNGVDNGRLWFDNLFIPRDNLLDRFATVDAEGTYSSPIPSSSKRFFTMLGTLVGGRISVAAAGLSAAKTGLTIAIRYGNRRRQFGPNDEPEVRILDYRTHQRRLFPLLANAYAIHFAIGDIRSRFAGRVTEEDQRKVEGLAGALKAFSSWNTTHTLQTAREACGGQGYLTVNRIATLKADTDVFTTFEGDNTVLMLQVAKGLLNEFRQEFNDMNFFGLLKYLREEAATRLAKWNPILSRQADEAHLRDPAFHLMAFQHREQDLLQSAARRMKDRIDRGVNSYDAFIEVQDHLVTLAHAHVKRVLMERFIDAVAACEDEGLKSVLTSLRNLFALYHLEEDRGWFLEQGYFDGNKTEAIRSQVNALCAELRPHAVPLVNAFAIPDALLAAPIALKEPPGWDEEKVGGKHEGRRET